MQRNMNPATTCGQRLLGHDRLAHHGNLFKPFARACHQGVHRQVVNGKSGCPGRRFFGSADVRYLTPHRRLDRRWHGMHPASGAKRLRLVAGTTQESRLSTLIQFGGLGDRGPNRPNLGTRLGCRLNGRLGVVGLQGACHDSAFRPRWSIFTPHLTFRQASAPHPPDSVVPSRPSQLR
jgi:hypothetical protein